MRYFVWEPSLTYPIASIWHDKMVDGNGKAKLTIGNPIALVDNDNRTINELKLIYPIEAKFINEL